MVRDADAFVQPAEARDIDGSIAPWYYEMDEVGLNYRVSDINCALGLSQLAKMDRFMEQRTRLVRRYDERLAVLAPAVRPLPRVAGCSPSWHLYVIQVDFAGLGIGRAELMRRLHAQGIGSQVHYRPVNRQPYYVRRYGEIKLPGADSYYGRSLSLPLFTAMTEMDVDRVVDALITSLRIAA
jgi:dTDP-4-amino-4,6-dideoxygalactose transaminase